MTPAGFHETPDGLAYAEHISLPLRLFVAAIGAAMFLVPVPFVVHAHAGMPWSHLLLAAVCVVAPCLLGLVFLAVALGRVLRLRFDRAQGRMLRSSRSPLRRRADSIPYDRITLPEVLQRSSEDGPYYVVRLAVAGERPLHLASFDARADAERWRERLQDELSKEPACAPCAIAGRL